MRHSVSDYTGFSVNNGGNTMRPIHVRFDSWFGEDHADAEVEADVIPPTGGTYFDPPDPGEAEITSVMVDGVECVGDLDEKDLERMIDQAFEAYYEMEGDR